MQCYCTGFQKEGVKISFNGTKKSRTPPNTTVNIFFQHISSNVGSLHRATPTRQTTAILYYTAILCASDIQFRLHLRQSARVRKVHSRDLHLGVASRFPANRRFPDFGPADRLLVTLISRRADTVLRKIGLCNRSRGNKELRTRAYGTWWIDPYQLERLYTSLVSKYGHINNHKYCALNRFPSNVVLCKLAVTARILQIYIVYFLLILVPWTNDRCVTAFESPFQWCRRLNLQSTISNDAVNCKVIKWLRRAISYKIFHFSKKKWCVPLGTRTVQAARYSRR